MLQFKLPTVNSNNRPLIQPKLKIGEPGDKYEREADAVADRIMRMSESETMQMQPEEEEEEMMQPKLRMQPMEEEEEELVQPKLKTGLGETIQMSCEECEEEMAQTKSNTNSYVSSALSHEIHRTKGTGQQLPRRTNQFMSSALGSDFSDVNIHANSDAHKLNQSIQAKAFTYGNNIYFNKGEYNPNSGSGKRLLAHELTHVVQQNYGKNVVQRDLAIAPPNPEAAQIGLLNSEAVSAALHYNLDRFTNAQELQTIRDVLGLTPDVSQLIDEEFVQSVASWQATHNLDIDGKLGRLTVQSLVDEYRAESHLAPSMTSRADRLAIRTRANQRARNVDVNGHNDLFDAVLSHRNAMLTLLMRINFRFHAGTTGTVPTAAQQTQFIREFRSDVHRIWSEMYALVPDGAQPANYLDNYFVTVSIQNTSTNPHFIAHIGSTTAENATTDPPGTVGAGGPAAEQDQRWLRMGTEDTGLFRGFARQTDAAGNNRPMTQYTGAHEFGHMIGLPHIHCDTNADNCYGTNDAERANIMGLGNRVTRANYAPFVAAMRAITGSRWKVRR